MVHKTSHRGVHSGHTLRAFNSRFSRRYHNQACIISRVRPELIKKLIGGGGGGKANGVADDKFKPADVNNNIAIDVALSLNKQSRWLLPSALIRQVRSNDIADDLTVSVLERHKLKSSASCVSFHSNKGDIKRIQPRNGRYFGFSFPTADGKSRRAWRREQREERKERLKNTPADKIVGKRVDVFTEQGRPNRDLNIGESEVRYEVYYPSPAHSSLSHNLKYIKHDVSDSPGDHTEHVQHGKPRKQHRAKQRKRMSLKDLDECDLASYPDHTDWDCTTFAAETETGELSAVQESPVAHKTVDCLLTSLIEKAERLQHVVGVAKSRCSKKKSGSKGLERHYQEDKSHIVFLDDSRDSEDEDSAEVVPIPLPAPSALSESTRVLLPLDDVTVKSLEDCFGKSYFEASCKPRKFVLDVTSCVRDLIKKQGVQAAVADHTQDAVTYLIFTHDGFYDDEYDVYKVTLNSRICPGLLAVKVTSEEQKDLYRGSVIHLISRTMDFVQGFVAKLQEQNHFPSFLDHAVTKPDNRHINSHLGSTEAYVPSVQRLFQQGSALSDVSMPSLNDLLLEEPDFCEVCYDDVSPLTEDSAPATALLKCRHRVCDSCWARHVHSRLHQGFVRVTCPGYDCQEEVGVGVLLSVAALDTVEKVLQRQEEVRIGASLTEKWCPNESCGRVLRLQATTVESDSVSKLQLEQDVLCDCGAHVCFQCLFPAHWPATCAQAEEYRTSLANNVFPDREAEVHDDSKIAVEAKTKRQQEENKPLLFEGKHCPKCRSVVYKMGEHFGCTSDHCQRCGQGFCWYCCKPGPSHFFHHDCVDRETKMTSTLVVHHLQHGDKGEESHKTSASRHQRISLLERAAEHHQRREGKQHQHLKAIAAISKAVATAAAKNPALAQHVISVSGGGASPSNSPSLVSPFDALSLDTATTAFSKPTSLPKRAPSVLETVTSFLKRVARGQQELHEVAEYSLVLLKDVPDSLLRRRALRISEDLGAFCTFTQSIFDAWGNSSGQGHGHLHEGVKAIVRLAEIEGWIRSALDSHVKTVRKIRSGTADKL